MGNKKIQKERMQRYFIEATKGIIEEQGLEEVSARKVARQAGYSYATIYNYFSDLNHLLWHVSSEYLQEITQRLDAFSRANDRKLSPAALVKGSFQSYISYYLEKPAVYQFLFFQQLGAPPEELRVDLATPLLINRLRGALQDCAKEGFLPTNDIPVLVSILTTMVHGFLSLYFTNKNQMTAVQLLEEVDANIDYIFSCAKGRIIEG